MRLFQISRDALQGQVFEQLERVCFTIGIECDRTARFSQFADFVYEVHTLAKPQSAIVRTIEFMRSGNLPIRRDPIHGMTDRGDKADQGEELKCCSASHRESSSRTVVLLLCQAYRTETEPSSPRMS